MISGHRTIVVFHENWNPRAWEKNREKRENIKFSSPSSVFQQKSRGVGDCGRGMWLFVKECQQGLETFRNFQSQFKMAWSGHQKFCFISLMTWQWQYVEHFMLMQKQAYCFFAWRGIRYFFSKLKYRKNISKFVEMVNISLLKPC